LALVVRGPVTMLLAALALPRLSMGLALVVAVAVAADREWGRLVVLVAGVVARIQSTMEVQVSTRKDITAGVAATMAVVAVVVLPKSEPTSQP
jgi:hypothetical protein